MADFAAAFEPSLFVSLTAAAARLAKTLARINSRCSLSACSIAQLVAFHDAKICRIETKHLKFHFQVSRREQNGNAYNKNRAVASASCSDNSRIFVWIRFMPSIGNSP